MRPIERPAFTAVLSSVLLAGCAARGGWFGPDELGPPFSDPELTVPAAALLVRQGESRKAEVIDRLGPAQVLRFDSGYEAWVYRSRGGRDARATPELVLLFDPSGVLARLRARPAYGEAGS